MTARTAIVFLGLLVSLASPVAAQSATATPGGALAARVREWRRSHEREVLLELRDLVALPNLASDADGIARNAAHLQGLLARRGFTTRLLTVPNAPPAVYGSLEVPGATRTVVFYAHYDGQPVTPADWATPAWTPALRAGTLEGTRCPRASRASIGCTAARCPTTRGRSSRSWPGSMR
jgi:hypothetical protein